MEQAKLEEFFRAKKKKAIIELCFRIAECAILLISAPFTILLKGWVAVHLWHWFVVPLGARELGVGVAAGTILIYRFMQPIDMSKPTKTEPAGRALGRTVFAGVVLPLSALAIGWSIHWMTK